MCEYCNASTELLSWLEELYTMNYNNSSKSRDNLKAVIEKKLAEVKQKFDNGEFTDTLANRLKYALSLIGKFFAVYVLKTDQSFVSFDSYKFFFRQGS